MLFSFRYRHLSAEDIDILAELRPRFNFITPPIERSLVRANICTLDGGGDRADREMFASHTLYARAGPLGRWPPAPVQAPDSGAGPELLSALRSTLLPPAQAPGWGDSADTRPSLSVGQSSTRSSRSTPGGSSDDELDETHVDLDAADSRPHCPQPQPLLLLGHATKPARPLSPVLPPLFQPQPQSPPPRLPPPHALLLELRKDDRASSRAPAARHIGAARPTPTMPSMQPNVEFRDAANSLLFREALSSDYPFEDVFAQYYPDAPRSILFYIQGNIALPGRTTLNILYNQYNMRQHPVVVWARVPVATDPHYMPQWRSSM
ncbi:hypothetical protein LPJ61_002069 [Coemansia biformis]|uniref:Uncharacterized protein n=1 Tax=Coemansia biformis TaxID=1286918 RepID=A0A9W7Y8Z1_9FUNG|nr:hypothetical protein LPJ61_002069 [Coemansia biformis]